jgi:hypothetical protein
MPNFWLRFRSAVSGMPASNSSGTVLPQAPEYGQLEHVMTFVSIASLPSDNGDQHAAAQVRRGLSP